MEEGIFQGWRKQSGDHVAVGDPLFELEGEKALQEIESVDAGILYIPEECPQPGSVVKVGSLLGYLLLQGDPIPIARSNNDLTEAGQSTREVSKSAAIEKDKPRTATPVASPRAIRVATELGIDWTQLHGTGRSGRIRESDVRDACDIRHLEPTAQTDSENSAGVRIALSTRRKQIAERLRLSRQRTIPVTLTTSIDATNLVAVRTQFKSANASNVPAYTDIVACLVARVLLRHPTMAARWERDHESLLQPVNQVIDISIAVDTPEGLLVPVIRDVGRKSLRDVTSESRSLIEQARNGSLTAVQMQGGFFTITNLGAFGIHAFTPVINYPEVAILGLGTIHREPVVMPDGVIVARDRMTLSLTFDHAAMDGAPAAGFLRDISTAIENPAAHLQ
jgi:pyruvate dehydrogenase E2 component (dihydrolipoamide acetyltransferase)